MYRSSIFITITFIFLLALTSIALAFWWLMGYDRENYARELNNKYSNVARANLFYMSGIIDKDQFERQMQGIDMPEISSAGLRQSILKDGLIIEKIEVDIGSSAIILYNKKHYLEIRHLDETRLLLDKDYQPYRYYVIKGIFAMVALVLLSAYIFVIYKIRPLRKLKRQIDKFASGDLDNVQNVSVGEDEISEVSQAFYDAVNQIKVLNGSRQLFLRNIMHELKTPITKGLITANMMPQGKSRERLVGIFNRLEGLINELAAVEQTTSGACKGVRIACLVEDIVDEAVDMALIDASNFELEILNSASLEVDFKLFATAVKNIIDNAIKYSPNKFVKIEVLYDEIRFYSLGDKLSSDLAFYIQPFIKGENSKNSFGLGLYIVSSILNSHGLNLDYEHRDGMNIFKFKNIASLRPAKEQHLQTA